MPFFIFLVINNYIFLMEIKNLIKNLLSLNYFALNVKMHVRILNELLEVTWLNKILCCIVIVNNHPKKQ